MSGFKPIHREDGARCEKIEPKLDQHEDVTLSMEEVVLNNYIPCV